MLLFLINKEFDSSIKKTINYILSGVSLSVAVFSIPHLAVLYILYVIAVIVITFLNRKKKSDGMIYTMYSLATLLKVSCCYDSNLPFFQESMMRLEGYLTLNMEARYN